MSFKKSELASRGKGLQENELTQLCLHYKDSYDLHRGTIKYRDLLFYLLLLILAAFSLHMVPGGDELLHQSLQTKAQVQIPPSYLERALWFLLFGISLRYYQLVVRVEREYNYLHHLEAILNGRYASTLAFSREGAHYQHHSGLFGNWLGILYSWIVPLGTVTVAAARIWQTEHERHGWIQPELVCFALLLVTTALYLVHIHTRKVTRLIEEASNVLVK